MCVFCVQPQGVELVEFVVPVIGSGKGFRYVFLVLLFSTQVVAVLLLLLLLLLLLCCCRSP